MNIDTPTMLELVDRIQTGDGSAYDELIRRFGRRLELVVRRMLVHYPAVARWEQAEDVLQNAHRRLWAALQEVTPPGPRSLMNLAAHVIRRELIDLARHYGGPNGLAANHDSDPQDGPRSRLNSAAPADPELEFWTQAHEAVGRLPEELREVMAMKLYAGMPSEAIAASLGVSRRTVRRRLDEAAARVQAIVAGGHTPPRIGAGNV